MNKLHKEILNEIKKKESKKKWEKINGYMGTSDHFYGLSSADRAEITKKFISENKNISKTELLELLNSLNKGVSFEEKDMVGILLEKFPEFRKTMDLDNLYRWLGNVEGWAEVDVICQSNFTAEEILGRREDWKELILKMSKDTNIHRRRASLVLLTKSLRQVNDGNLSGLAFVVLNRLKGEKEILITKAVSWVLRSMVKNYRECLEAYLAANHDKLPKIAIRETMAKLKTGRKSGK